MGGTFQTPHATSLLTGLPNAAPNFTNHTLCKGLGGVLANFAHQESWCIMPSNPSQPLEFHVKAPLAGKQEDLGNLEYVCRLFVGVLIPSGE